MDGRWDFYLCLIEDQPASVFLDMNFAKRAPMRGFAHFGYIRIYMRNPRPDGLSSNEEFEALARIDDLLTGDVIARCKAHYVGRTTSDGARTYYFYIARPEEFERAANGAMARHVPYEFDTGHRSDPDWGVYREFLYPSPAARQQMLNRGVLEALRDHGDDNGALRPIEHWAYFARRDDALKFAGYVEAEGFAVSERASSCAGRYLVRFDRVDRPSGVDDVVIPLHTRASELAGEYDGWECQVVTPE